MVNVPEVQINITPASRENSVEPSEENNESTPAALEEIGDVAETTEEVLKDPIKEETKTEINVEVVPSVSEVHVVTKELPTFTEIGVTSARNKNSLDVNSDTDESNTIDIDIDIDKKSGDYIEPSEDNDIHVATTETDINSAVPIDASGFFDISRDSKDSVVVKVKENAEQFLGDLEFEESSETFLSKEEPVAEETEGKILDLFTGNNFMKK